MSTPFSREEALRMLGVSDTADATTVKQAYRRLAREHHPDHGGDAGTFHRLQRAYERVIAHESSPAPTVSKGRPSRRPAPHTNDHDLADVGSVDWEPIGDGRGPLDRDRLANLLAIDGAEAVAAVVATSRSPGSRLNRVAAHLSPALTARLVLRQVEDDQGRTLVAVEVTAAGRRARRAVDRAELDEVWSRTRRASSTVLRTTLTPSPDHRATALRAANRAAELLAGLDWPLAQWTSTCERP